MAKALTLLDRAKAHSPKPGRPSKTTTPEELDLAYAWLRDEVSNVQIAAAYGIENGQAPLYRLANAIRAAYRAGNLKIVA